MSDIFYEVAFGITRVELSKAKAEIERLRAAGLAAMQRLNESGTGEMGLTDTIHATHRILAAAFQQSGGDTK